MAYLYLYLDRLVHVSDEAGSDSGDDVPPGSNDEDLESSEEEAFGKTDGYKFKTGEQIVVVDNQNEVCL